MGEGRREEGEVGGWLASSNDKRDILGEKAKKQTNERERERERDVRPVSCRCDSK